MSQQYFSPTFVTLTGASDDTNFRNLIEISEQFPFVEWAILYSYDRSGVDPRYPSIHWIQRFLDEVYVCYSGRVNFAIHLCGRVVNDFVLDQLNSKATFIREYMTSPAMRLQLNFSIDKVKFSAKQLQERISEGTTPIITQHNSVNSMLTDYITSDNHHVLFDSSGGRGIVRTSWPFPIPERMCGYAGGLGPENISTAAIDIMRVASPPYWIDMESNLRTDDKLDLSKCIEVLQVVDGLMVVNDNI